MQSAWRDRVSNEKTKTNNISIATVNARNKNYFDFSLVVKPISYSNAVFVWTIVGKQIAHNNKDENKLYFLTSFCADVFSINFPLRRWINQNCEEQNLSENVYNNLDAWNDVKNGSISPLWFYVSFVFLQLLYVQRTAFELTIRVFNHILI